MAKKKVRKVNGQKIFSFMSFVFILVCCLWYGGRFIYYYLENKKSYEENSDTLSANIISNNKDSDNFKNINNSYYFVNDANGNYVRYSNIVWRIIKIDSDNKMYLISDNAITSLAFGTNIQKYNDSYVYKWLNNSNEDNSGILENNLNNMSSYLAKYKVCIDNVDDVKNVGCDSEYSDGYLGLLSIIDYVNTGGDDSFINNGQNVFLSNSTKDNEVWYINDSGKLDKSDGTDVYGVKPVIVLNATVSAKSGDGSSDNPYQIDDKSLFASYVKLDNDIWRVYEVDDNSVKLILQDYLTIDSEKLSYSYSKKNYYHNDSTYGSLAYYLNHTYLNSLSYKDLVLNGKYANGYYDSDYDYTKILASTVDTYVSCVSVGNSMFVSDTSGFWTNTGTSENSEMVYVFKNNMSLTSKSVESEQYVIPVISIDKSILTKGEGTLSSPYEME